ncbi:uncharacterized protein LOC110836607 [Zootermopsis nevadensis]|uniref:uncharacterized protein LOC110836607 n=1 Tax=Zootermopsis nevadensis TaxID=136037 RepID=UPI000B8EE69D|nr:uncharacterized protein LOC110836607 [Zootermopsis nevadensis]
MLTMRSGKNPVFLPQQKPPKKVPSAKMTFSTSRAGAKTEEMILKEPTPPLVPPAMLTSQFPSTGLDKDKLAELLSVACSMCKPTTPASRSVLLCFACASSTP